MSKKDTDIYARWLQNKLTDAELEQLKASGDLPLLERIVSETDTWEVPAPVKTYAELKKKLLAVKQAPAKVITLYSRLAIAAGLAFVAMLGILFYNYNKTVSYKTLAGEIKTVLLPDNTVLVLRGNSSLSYKPRNWKSHRVVNMEGRVFFEVKRKGDFLVNFDGGSVAVKGTAFDIVAAQGFRQVKCYHGKVIATLSQKAFDLGPGMGVDSDLEKFEFKGTGILSEYTKFENAKLAEVLAALSSQFGYTFEMKKDYSGKTFTGQYMNSNGLKALETVFTSLSISYHVNGKRVILK